MNDKGVLIQNIFYMLSYAFQVLKHSNYESVASEKFDHIQDMFAAILVKGISKQLKQGLYKKYVTMNEEMPVLKGKLDINATIQNRIQRKQKLSCEFDELSVNNIYNQILKTTMIYLLKDDGVSKKQKTDLHKILVFFDGVETLNPKAIAWNRLQYQRNNRNYEMLLNICYFVMDGMLQTDVKGRYRMESFSYDHM